MARVIGSIAAKKTKSSSFSLSEGQKKASSRISKKPRSTGRITKKEHPISVPYEISLHEDLKEDKIAFPYLEECFENDMDGLFTVALRHFVMARGGVAKIAKAAGLNRESLYKTLSQGGNPEVNTLRKILAALKVKVKFVKA